MQFSSLLTKQNLIFILIAALVIAVVSLSIGMSWALKLVQELSNKEEFIPGGPSIIPPSAQNLTPQAVSDTANQQPQNTTSVEQKTANPLVSLVTKPDSQSCYWNTIDPVTKQSTLVSTYNTPNQFLITVSEGSKTKTSSFILRKAENIYLWQDVLSEGIRLPSKVLLEESLPESNYPVFKVVKNLFSQSFVPTCEPWSEIEAVFMLPKDIAFSTLQANGSSQTNTSSSSASAKTNTSSTKDCSVCQMLSPEAKTECLAKCLE